MPDWRNEIRQRLAGLRLEPTREDEIIEELSQHLDDRYSELRADGLTAAEARRAVLIELQDGQLLAEELRRLERTIAIVPVLGEPKGRTLMNDLWQDVRYGLRVLRQHPGFTLIAVVTLALGIGANTAIFSLVNGILLRPLPYREPDRLVRLIQSSPALGLPTWGISQADFVAYRDQNSTFETFALFTNGGVNLTGDGEPEHLSVTNVSADFFKVFAANPMLGRTFQEGEDTPGKNGVCVISYGLWQRRFGGDPQVIGKGLTLNNTPTEIVGVMPAEFKYPRLDTEMWIPLALNPTRTAPYGFSGIGRMQPGVQIAQAQADTTNIVQNFGRQHPDKSEAAGLKEGNGPRTIVTPLKETLVGKTEKPLLVLLSAVAAVLLIACANVANLLLARATARTREIAVRVALGATPSRIARQLLTESVLLSFIGAVVGTGLAALGLRLLDRIPITGVARIEEVSLSGAVLAFTAGLALLTGLLFGLVPALRAYGMGLAAGMNEGGRGSSSNQRLGSALVAAQFALSLILLIGTGLLLKSFQRLESVNPGFNPEQTLTMSATLPRTRYNKPELAMQFYNNTIERLRNAPGVQAVGFATDLPFAGNGNEDGFLIEGQTPPDGNVTHMEQAVLQAFTPGVLQALGLPLLSGRDFQETDTANSPAVALIDEPLARHYFPNGDAIGKRIETTGDLQWMTIVGIVGGVHHFNLGEERQPHIYTPMAQNTDSRAFLIVRTDSPPAAMMSTVRAAVKQVEPDLPIYQVRSMTELVGQTLSTQRLTNGLLTAFAVLALLLAAVGIYGTMSVYVGSRTKEFGIRLALGAQPNALLLSVLRQGLRLTAAGVAVGLAGALALTQTIKSLLFEVSTTDPSIFISLPVLLVTVALAACYVPARRSARVDPLVALRYE
ncbi:MAG TPA: ABC transporter permease [Blastocatellia bacterium]|nr:ABC transporter permease [Blastocatellia bacterium]